MKRNILYVFLLMLAVFSGCIKEEPCRPGGEAPEYPAEGKAVVHMCASFPVAPSTKAMADLPSISLIRVAVFGSSGFLKEVVDAENVQAASTNGSSTLYNFDVKLSLTDSKNLRVNVFANCNAKLPWKYEGVVMCGTAYTTGNQDAYWARFILPNGIALKMVYDDDPEVQSMVYVKTGNFYEVDDSVTEAFCGGKDGSGNYKGLPMLRNFAKMSVESTTPQLTLDATHTMAIINMPDRGSVAPYDPTRSLFMMDYKDMTYAELKSSYPGYSPDSMAYVNTNPDNVTFYPCTVTNGQVNGGIYMYERPKPSGSSDSPTYIIIHGYYRALKEGKVMSDWKSTSLAADKRYPNDVDTWLVPAAQAVEGYYKIDLMDDDGYYAVFRNFRYHLRITGVSKAGAETPGEAGSTGGSGDISTSQETQGLTDISNGYGRIAVSYVERTFVERQAVVELKYKFIPDVEEGDETLDNSLVSEGGPVVITFGAASGSSPINVIANTLDSTIASETGVVLGTASGDGATGVIKVMGSGNDSNDTEGYRTIKFTTNNPSTLDPALQTIHISGMIDEYRSISRDINFYLMDYQDMTVWCEADNPDPHFATNAVEDEAGEGINLFINIPTQLPESMFPLVFVIESDKLSITPNITADYHDNLPVESGSSICDGKSGKKTFHYNYTLSYADYNLLPDVANGGGKTFTLHFKTNMDDSASTIYVANEYFNKGSAAFTNYSVYNFTNLWFSIFAASYNTNLNFTFYLDSEDDATSRTITVQLEGLRPQNTNSPWAVVDEGSGLYTYTYSRNAGVGGQMVTLPVKTLAQAQHTGSYSVTLSLDGAGGVPIYREKEKSNTKISTSITFTSANTVTQDDVTVSFYNASYYSNSYGIRYRRYNTSTPGYFEVSVPDGYSLVGITFSFTNNSARTLSVTAGTFSYSGQNATWTTSTSTKTVRFNNTTNNYVYIKTINVEYIKLE